MDDKNISCCFTGHRQIEYDRISFIKAALETEIEKMILKGIRNFYCGGAISFDMLAGKIVIAFRAKYDIQFILAIPCRGQS